MLGIIHMLREWRGNLLSSQQKFMVYTDHIGLKFFRLPQNLSYQHARWSVELADYHMEIAYVKASHNVIADALSRSPIVNLEDLKQDKVVTLLPKDLWLPDTDATHISRVNEDPTDRLTQLKLAHDHILSGHPGIAQTLRNLEPHTWTGMHGDVKEYVLRCPECQRFKNQRSRPRGVLHPLPPATSPFERISIDHIGPLPKSNGYDAILVVVDFFTKFKILIACRTTDDSPAFVQSYLTYVFPYF